MKTNIAKTAHTHEGAVAQQVDPYRELRRTVLSCFLWEDTFYEAGNAVAIRIEKLCTQVPPEKVAELAVEARQKMHLRHVPLFLTRQVARMKGQGPLVADSLETVIERADELAEFVSLYWKKGKQPLSAGVKRGLARAFTKFNAYNLAKYNRDGAVKLRDVLFLCHAKPKDAEQEQVWKALVAGTLAAPDTWEVELSAGKDKKEVFERLLREKKLGGLAVLRNLRNMQQAHVDERLIRERLAEGVRKALPFRFIAAARYAPALEDVIEQAMFKAVAEIEEIPGRTGLLVDISGSMDGPLSGKSEMTRLEAAAALAILLREKSNNAAIATFSNKMVILPPRHGFALRDAINTSQAHQETYTGAALKLLADQWKDLDRLIVITDEQSYDPIPKAWCKGYFINVGTYQHGISYGNGWTHIDGWSERALDYILETEKEEA